MIKRKSQILVVWFLVWDLASTALAWLAAYYVRFNWLPVYAEPPTFAECFSLLPLVVLMAAIAYRLTGQYVTNRFRRLREELVGIVKGTALMGLLVIAGTFSIRSHYESRATFMIFCVLTAVLICVTRRTSWFAIRWLRSRGFNQTHSIVIGTGRVARKTARALRGTAWLGIKNVGFVEDQPSRWASDLDVLGAISDLPTLVAKYQVSHVFICVPMNRYHEARRVFDTLSQTLVEVRLIADVPTLAGLSLTTTSFDGMPMVGLRESPHFGLNVVIKRVMDVTLSLVALVLIAPVMLLVAAIIKLTSPGPIFYRQERCGLNGQSFMMLKFRSMRLGAESQTGAVWAQKDDPRRTWFGSFLRGTSLDELPQFLNVLRGDMSIVGPRPERPVFIAKFSKTIPNYCARHAVKAGITGWAQVHGWRGNTSLRKRLQYDLYYITHWTPWLDIRILWMTVWHGLVNRNAYEHFGVQRYNDSMFVDRIEIFVKGGDGGRGCLSFRREKYVPKGGPDGGEGGDGGSVILRAEADADNLAPLVNRRHWRAESGSRGEPANRSGKSGADLVIPVPPGTIVFDRERGHILRDLTHPGDEVIVGKGGRGGRGNKSFASPTNRTPRETQPGIPGEERWLTLELKVIADAGLVGLPNAGKSTLLSRLSQATPEIADYPFTTKHPNLGIVHVGHDRRMVLADLPGLIEGAHSGIGLGHEFLRHVERTRVLVHLVEPLPSDDSDPLANYRTVRRELELYSQALAEQPEVVAVSKCELTGSDDVRARMESELGREVLGVSAVTGQGLSALVNRVTSLLSELQRSETP